MPILQEEYKKTFETPESFVEYFTYLIYDPDEKIFINRDGSFARLYNIASIPSEMLSEEEIKIKSKLLEGLMLRLPEQTICQVLYFSDDEIQNEVDEYKNFTQETTDPKINLYTTNKTGLFLNGRKSLFKYHGYNYSVKRVRVYFTIKYKPDWLDPKFYDKVVQYITGKDIIRKRYKEKYRDLVKEFVNRCEIAESIFTGLQAGHESLGPQGLINFLYKFFNPRRAEKIPPQKYRDDIPLYEQFLRSSIKNDDFWALTSDGIKNHVLTLPQLSLNEATGVLSREGKAGSGREALALMDMVKGLIYCINFYIPDQSKEDLKLSVKSFLAHFTGDKEASAKVIKKEIAKIREDVFTLGERLIFARAHFIVRGENRREIDSRSTLLATALSSLGYESIREEILSASLIRTCMPFNFDPVHESSIQRGLTNEARYINDMLPVFGSFKGTRTPMHMFLNRRGEICYFDFFEGGGPHGVVTGATRAGKSFYINAVILDALRKGAMIFMVDKGHSYKKLINMMEGLYMSVDLNQPICLNPFRDDKLTPVGLKNCSLIIAEMASGGDERDRLRGEEIAILQEGIREIYKLSMNRQRQISDLRTALEKMGDLGKSLSRRISQFSQGGPYGGFFDGQETLDFNKRIIGLEIGDITDILMAPLLLSYKTKINSKLRSVSRGDVRAYDFTDEAWRIMKSQHCADFIEEDARTKAKLHCSCIAITQQTMELDNKAGLAILGNSRNKIFLRQNPEIILKMRSLFELSDTEVAALRSLRSEWKKFSEFMIKTDEICGIMRYVADPFTYWVSTSEKPDNDLLNMYLDKNNGDYFKAISDVIKEKPYGVL